MKRQILIILIVAAFFRINGQGLEAYFTYGVYNAPNIKPYVETYLTITGRSINWEKSPSGPKSSIEITMVLWQDTTIISYSKEIINETLKSDSLMKTSDLTYLQRLEAGEGKYRIQLKLDDLNDTIKPTETGTFIDISFPKDSTCISSIMIVKSSQKTTIENKTSKSGYDLVPYVLNFFPTKIDKLTFYTEIYPNEKIALGEPLLLVYYLKNHESRQILPNYKGFKRINASKANILLQSIDISNLYSGNFNLIVEVRNSTNQLLAIQTLFIQRENSKATMDVSQIAEMNIKNTFVEKMTSFDTLLLFLRSLDPISSETEKEFVKNTIAKKDIYVMQQYLLRFWEQRNLENPEVAFKKYLQEVTIVEKMYGTRISKGFETDRGRVYLQYGAPNTVVKNYNEPSAYPHEIWHYYTLENQRNRKFVFYNTDLSTNEFALLHSDATGEPNDYQWRLRLRSRDTGWESIHDTGQNQSDWGSNYNDWYSEPR